MPIFFNFYLFIFNFFNVYLFLRERERKSVSREGAEREGDTESQAVSMLSAQSLKRGLNSQNREIMT